MPERHLVATTNAREFRSLSAGGQRAINSYDQLVGYVRRSLSAEHAGLFAEPFPDESKGTIDWYADISGDAKPLSSLTEAEQQAARDRLATLTGEIRTVADSLSSSSQSNSKKLGEQLNLALQFPSDDHVMVAVGDDSVRVALVNWGHARDQVAVTATKLVAEAPPPKVEERAVPAQPVAPAAGQSQTTGPVPGAVTRRSALWPLALLWLLFATIMAGNYYLLLEGCAVSGPSDGDSGWWFADFCPVPPAVAETDPVHLAFLDEQARGNTLRNRRDQLAVRIAEQRRECRPPQPPPIIVESVDEPPVAVDPGLDEAPDRDPDGSAVEPDPFDDRVEREGGDRGDYQITLIWEGDADLDLHVECPGDRIYFGSRSGCGGGQLNIDANQDAMLAAPVENVTWSGRPPSGTYSVRVDNFNGRSAGNTPVPYRVRVRTPEGVVELDGQISQSQETPVVHQFTVP